MGRYCRICGRERPNEQFSGKRRSPQVCRRCKRRVPKTERERILSLDEIWGFLRQSRISSKNVARLSKLVASTHEEVRWAASLVANIARVKPTKRKRLGFLRHHHPDLYWPLVDVGQIQPPYDILELDDEPWPSLEWDTAPTGYDSNVGPVWSIDPAPMGYDAVVGPVWPLDEQPLQTRTA